MKSNKIGYIILISIYFVYLFLGISGFYAMGFVFFFPMLALPLAIWNLGNKQNFKRDLLFHLTLVVFIFALTHDVDNTLLYLINCTIPVMIITYSYRKKIDLPHLIAYTSLGVIVSIFILVTLRQYTGYNYLATYLDIVQMYKDIQFEAIEILTKQGQMMFSNDQIDLIKETIILGSTLLTLIYPALLILGVLILTTLFVFFVAAIGALKKWRLPSIKQLVQFKLSKFAVLAYGAGWLLLQAKGEYAAIGEMLGVNIFFLMQSIFQFIGIISLIMIIKKLSLGTLGRSLLTFCSLILFFMSPTIIMMIGVFDTLFDYRKAPIVV